MLTDLPQHRHISRFPCHRPFHHLNAPPHHRPLRQRIRGRHSLHFDNPDTRIIRATIMYTVPLVTDPGFQSWGVVFLDRGAVGEDGGGARNGGPGAVVGDEGDVDVGVGGEVVGFARGGVGMKEVVNAAGFLVIEVGSQVFSFICREYV